MVFSRLLLLFLEVHLQRKAIQASLLTWKPSEALCSWDRIRSWRNLFVRVRVCACEHACECVKIYLKSLSDLQYTLCLYTNIVCALFKLLCCSL